MSKTHHIIPIFVPHRGCPHDCVFCNQKKVTGLYTDITQTQVEHTINDYLKTIPINNKTLEIAFFGGSFTGIRKEIQIELLQTAKKYKDIGAVDYIRLSTRPDYISIEILDLLHKMSVDTIELGVQSLDRDVLIKSNRGHTVEDVLKSAKLIKKYNFNLGLQMMLGLPGDTKTKAIKTAIGIVELKPDFVRIYPTLVIKDTLLEKLYLNSLCKPLTLSQAVNICKDLLMIFRYNKIDVIRIGLQPTDNISLEKDIVEGPFHPSIRQLVEAKLYEKILNSFFDKTKIQFNEITFKVNSKEVSNIAGQNSSNLNLLKSKYGIKRVKVVPVDISKEFFYVMIKNKEYKIDINKYIEQYINEFNNL